MRAPRFSLCLLGLIFGSLAVPTAAWAQPRTVPASAEVPAALKALWPPGQPGVDYNLTDAKGLRTGTWMRVYPTGALYYTGGFRAGKPLGTFTFYYESGERMSVIVHDATGDGMQATHYRKDGTVRAEGRYLPSGKLNEEGEPAREKDGLWKYYDERGTLRLEEGYRLGVLHGPTRLLDAAGKVLETGGWLDGERDGMWTRFDAQGQVLSEISYAMGLFDGPHRTFAAPGKPEREGQYVEGEPHGIWKLYEPNGNLRTIQKFEAGTLVQEQRHNGTFEDFYPSGLPKSVITYKLSKPEGPFREWHDVGTFELVESTDPETGEPDVRKTPVGVQVKREGAYLDGQLHGKVTHYTERGAVEKVETWERGVLKSSGGR